MEMGFPPGDTVTETIVVMESGLRTSCACFKTRVGYLRAVIGWVIGTYYTHSLARWTERSQQTHVVSDIPQCQISCLHIWSVRSDMSNH